MRPLVKIFENMFIVWFFSISFFPSAVTALMLLMGGAGLAGPDYLGVDVDILQSNGLERAKVSWNGTTLLNPDDTPFETSYILDSELTVLSQAVTECAGGFDVHFVLTNNTSVSQPRPTVSFQGLNLSSDFYLLDSRDVGRFLGPYHYDADTPEYLAPSFFWFYPAQCYSPVALIKTENFSIGMSYLYGGEDGVLSDKYEVASLFKQYTAWAAGKFAIKFIRHRDVGGPSSTCALVPPGQSEAFSIAVRFAPSDNAMDALTPYRNYLDSKFVGVSYPADKRPIYAFHFANAAITTNNFRGFASSTDTNDLGQLIRLDKDGWDVVRSALFTAQQVSIQNALNAGYQRTMFWLVSGAYSTGVGMPVEFVSEMNTLQKETLSPGLMEPVKWGYGGSVGFWKGMSSHYNPVRDANDNGIWNPTNLCIRRAGNTNSYANLAGRDAELDEAWNMGVNIIGLDAFGMLPVWDRKVYLENLITSYPYIQFITEPADCDIIHRLAPTFTKFDALEQFLNTQPSTNQATSRLSDITPVLANFLNQGHETWVNLTNPTNSYYFNMITNTGMVPLTMRGIISHNATDYPSGCGTTMIAQWLMDEPSWTNGTRVYDSGLNHHDGVAFGGANTITNSTGGGYCGLFSGDGGVVVTNDSELLDFEEHESFTISFWVKLPAGTVNPKYILSKGYVVNGDSNSCGYAVMAWAGQGQVNVPVGLSYHDGGTYQVVSAGTISRDVWHHVAFSFDRNNQEVRTYRDGVPGLVSSIPAGLGGLENDWDFSIGAHHETAHLFTGYLDDLCVWDYALSDVEVEDLASP
jgi:hypothetical protein